MWGSFLRLIQSFSRHCRSTRSTWLTMADAKYFSTTKKGMLPWAEARRARKGDLLFSKRFSDVVVWIIGEIFELREDLNSMKEDKKKEAVKKVIAAMTIGMKFLCSNFCLFCHLCACNIGLSADMPIFWCARQVRMYLRYLPRCWTAFRPIIWNWKSWFTCTSWTTPRRNLTAQSWLWTLSKTYVSCLSPIESWNCFSPRTRSDQKPLLHKKDANDANPLIRALAIRTMGCIRVDKIVEYVCEPLRRALNVRWPFPFCPNFSALSGSIRLSPWVTFADFIPFLLLNYCFQPLISIGPRPLRFEDGSDLCRQVVRCESRNGGGARFLGTIEGFDFELEPNGGR